MAAKAVLVVDDEESIRNVWRDVLRGEGYEVLTAENGCRAVEIYEQNAAQIILVILDVRMPVMSGDEALIKMRKINPDVRAVCLTGFSSNQQKESLIANGCRVVLKKPCKLGDLLSAVKENVAPDSSS